MSGGNNVIKQRFAYPIAGAAGANVTVNFSAGTISVAGLKNNNQLLVEILDEHGGRPKNISIR
jgi:hypothetical protein